MTDKEQFMKEAVNAALKGMNNNEGGPFGCVIVKDGKIVVRRIMNISSSFDHRIVDGANGAALIQALKRMLQHPALIFM